jgi:hypothetical protein
MPKSACGWQRAKPRCSVFTVARGSFLHADVSFRFGGDAKRAPGDLLHGDTRSKRSLKQGGRWRRSKKGKGLRGLLATPALCTARRRMHLPTTTGRSRNWLGQQLRRSAVLNA